MKRSLAFGFGVAALPLAAFALTPEAVGACLAVPAGQGCAEQAARIAACQADVAAEGCGAVLLAHDLAANWGVGAAAEAETGGEATAQAEAPADPDLANAPVAEPTPAETAEAEALAEDPADACPVIASTGWRAAVGMVPGGKDRMLVVEGTVTLPTPGWRLELAPGMADRSARPVQHFELLASPPAEIVAQVLTDYAAYAETPALGAYRGVVVTCEGRVLAEIADIR